MGHLARDSYEPSEGKFDFAWFNKVMDMMNQAGIKVILDIAIHPAPIWLHHKFPSIDVVNTNGDVQYPNHRYMDDVGDPNYQKYAVKYTDSLSKHYGKHSALLAFGIDNESGDGPISYSETVRFQSLSTKIRAYICFSQINNSINLCVRPATTHLKPFQDKQCFLCYLLMDRQHCGKNVNKLYVKWA